MKVGGDSVAVAVAVAVGAATVAVDVKNSAEANSAWGGAYKNYLRFILPVNANLTKIQIDGKVQQIIPAVTDPAVYEKTGFVPPSGLEVQKENQGQNTLYGLLINVVPQTTKSIRVEYALAQKINLSQPEITYDLKQFKQPGIDAYGYNFVLNLPSGFKILDLSSDVKTNNNQALLSTEITRDREVLVNLVAR